MMKKFIEFIEFIEEEILIRSVVGLFAVLLSVALLVGLIFIIFTLALIVHGAFIFVPFIAMLGYIMYNFWKHK
jgi:uncharacterized membrane protein YGL010W